MTPPTTVINGLNANELGEIADFGPPWSCAMYGLSGHDYCVCPHCNDHYARHLAAIRSGGKP